MRFLRFLVGVIFLDLGVGFFLTIASTVFEHVIQSSVPCFASAAGSFLNANGLKQGRNAVAQSFIAGAKLAVQQPGNQHNDKGGYDGGGSHLFSEVEKGSNGKYQHEVDDLLRCYLL
jgi:hypothetical protein